MDGKPEPAVDAQKKGSFVGDGDVQASTSKEAPPVDDQPGGSPELKSKSMSDGTVALKLTVTPLHVEPKTSGT